MTESPLAAILTFLAGMGSTFLTLFFAYRKSREKLEADEKRRVSEMLEQRTQQLFDRFTTIMEEERKSCELKIKRMESDIARLQDALGPYKRPTRRGESQED